MKKILFYYDNYCGPDSRGGTEVATHRIASALNTFGNREVYNAFLRKRNDDTHTLYKDIIRLRKPKSLFVKDLSRFLKDNEIECVVNMGRFYRQRKLKEAISKSGRDIRLVFMHHFAPGSENKKSTYSAGFHLFRLNPFNPLYWLRATVYPLIKLPRRLGLKKAYRSTALNSDAIVLLSEGYKKEYEKIAGIQDDSVGTKFYAIPNIFDKLKVNNTQKEKRVLILSRMDEIQKRISTALKIWKIIEESGEFNDWTLDIVGHGHEFGSLKRYAEKIGLKRAIFHGWQKSDQYLQRSEILMMTSDYEGLSLSMVEAQQYGCIPIAFDSYASLKDIVNHEQNGIIVEKSEAIDGFASSLASLMRNEDLRKKMRENRMEKTVYFSPSSVAEKWNRMLENI